VITMPLRSAGWARVLTMTRKATGVVEVTDDAVSVRMGWVGHADIPMARVARVTIGRWPWYAGMGVRVAKGMVAFALVPGDGVRIEFDGPITVHGPAPWDTRAVLLVVDDPAALAEAIAERRGALDDAAPGTDTTAHPGDITTG
jgi:hypothetical protein